MQQGKYGKTAGEAKWQQTSFENEKERRIYFPQSATGGCGWRVVVQREYCGLLYRQRRRRHYFSSRSEADSDYSSLVVCSVQ